jgi:hypothetical protein
MQIASASLKQAEKNWAEYEALPRDPRQSDAAAMEIKRNYDIYHGALAELISCWAQAKSTPSSTSRPRAIRTVLRSSTSTTCSRTTAVRSGGEDSNALTPGYVGAD